MEDKGLLVFIPHSLITVMAADVLGLGLGLQVYIASHTNCAGNILGHFTENNTKQD